jgi:hypothetical protein
MARMNGHVGSILAAGQREDVVTGFAALAVVAVVGIVGMIGFVLWISRGIKREDRSNLRGNVAPDLVSRTARRWSGLHVRGELTSSHLA